MGWDVSFDFSGVCVWKNKIFLSPVPERKQRALSVLGNTVTTM